ncbi:MAG: L,D-transpeptidase family protein [Hyphomicrobium sp.]|nr:L,D-transpeptidase family protein [Hyphomicrobium sp.]
MHLRYAAFLCLAWSAFSAGAVAVQDATEPQSAATEDQHAVSPDAAPVAALQDPLGIALQEKLAASKNKGNATVRADRAVLSEYYSARKYKAVWVDASGLKPRAKATLAEIEKAGDWGLDANAFVLPKSEETNAKTPAEAEITLSLAILKYARHAHGGRIMDPAGTLSSYLDRTPQLLEPKSVLVSIASDDQPDAYLRSLHPRHPQFERLRKAYLALREAGPPQKLVTLPKGSTLRPGKKHRHVALLRKRLGLEVPQVDGKPGNEKFYDEALKEAVIAFKKEKGIEPVNGIVNRSVRDALNNVRTITAEQLQANMEQWRWMPSDLGNLYVWVNVPEFTLRIAKNGEIVHTERAITGLVGKQTPVFSEDIKMIVFRPRWNVPNSIKVRELWPSLARGGRSFKRQGLRLSRNGRVIDPRSVDWSQDDIRHFDVYQPPGSGNALGNVKFVFPNKHLVYMHDTPTKSLFDKTTRTFSHGCMRIRNPQRMAEILLAEDKRWDTQQVDDLIKNGPGNNEVGIDRRIPVHVTYFTAWVDDEGETQTARDVYGHEKRIKLALAGKWLQIAKGPNHLAPVKIDPNMRARINQSQRPSTPGDYIQSVLGGGF